jgi:hypothetical protein
MILNKLLLLLFLLLLLLLLLLLQVHEGAEGAPSECNPTRVDGRHREAGVRVSSADWFKAGVARQRADPISLGIAPPRVYDSE